MGILFQIDCIVLGKVCELVSFDKCPYVLEIEMFIITVSIITFLGCIRIRLCFSLENLYTIINKALC